MAIESLSNEEKAFAEKNHNMIYSVLNSMKLSDDEYYDIAAIGLIKAVKIYDKSKGTFSTLAFKVIKNELLCELRNEARHIQNDLVSLSCDVGESGEIQLIDLIKSDDGFENGVIELMSIVDNLKYLSDRQLEILLASFSGERQDKISDALNIKPGSYRTMLSNVRVILGSENINKKPYECTEYRTSLTDKICDVINGGPRLSVRCSKAKTDRKTNVHGSVACKKGDKQNNIKLAIYAGSFDPLTNGHLDIIKKASKLFDRLIVGVGVNRDKSHYIVLSERVKLAKEACKDIPNVEVESFEGMLVDFANKHNASCIVRGLREVTDFSEEFKLSLINKSLNADIETIFIPCSTEYMYISSSMVKQLNDIGADISKYVPSVINIYLNKGEV